MYEYFNLAGSFLLFASFVMLAYQKGRTDAFCKDMKPILDKHMDAMHKIADMLEQQDGPIG